MSAPGKIRIIDALKPRIVRLAIQLLQNFSLLVNGRLTINDQETHRSGIGIEQLHLGVIANILVMGTVMPTQKPDCSIRIDPFCTHRDGMKRFRIQICAQHSEVDGFGQFLNLASRLVTLQIFRGHQ